MQRVILHLPAQNLSTYRVAASLAHYVGTMNYFQAQKIDFQWVEYTASSVTDWTLANLHFRQILPDLSRHYRSGMFLPSTHSDHIRYVSVSTLRIIAR